MAVFANSAWSVPSCSASRLSCSRARERWPRSSAGRELPDPTDTEPVRDALHRFVEKVSGHQRVDLVLHHGRLDAEVLASPNPGPQSVDLRRRDVALGEESRLVEVGERRTVPLVGLHRCLRDERDFVRCGHVEFAARLLQRGRHRLPRRARLEDDGDRGSHLLREGEQVWSSRREGSLLHPPSPRREVGRRRRSLVHVEPHAGSLVRHHCSVVHVVLRLLHWANPAPGLNHLPYGLPRRGARSTRWTRRKGGHTDRRARGTQSLSAARARIHDTRRAS